MLAAVKDGALSARDLIATRPLVLRAGMSIIFWSCICRAEAAKRLTLCAPMQLFTTFKNNPNGVFVGPFVNRTVPALPPGSLYSARASPIPDLAGLRK